MMSFWGPPISFSISEYGCDDIVDAARYSPDTGKRCDGGRYCSAGDVFRGFGDSAGADGVCDRRLADAVDIVDLAVEISERDCSDAGVEAAFPFRCPVSGRLYGSRGIDLTSYRFAAKGKRSDGKIPAKMGLGCHVRSYCLCGVSALYVFVRRASGSFPGWFDLSDGSRLWRGIHHHECRSRARCSVGDAFYRAQYRASV